MPLQMPPNMYSIIKSKSLERVINETAKAIPYVSKAVSYGAPIFSSVGMSFDIRTVLKSLQRDFYL